MLVNWLSTTGSVTKMTTVTAEAQTCSTANFHGVNTSIMADFIIVIPKYLIISSLIGATFSHSCTKIYSAHPRYRFPEDHSH